MRRFRDLATIYLKVRHARSCELNGIAAKFIRDTFGVKTIFTDMREMIGKVGDVHVTNKTQRISSASISAGGFTCTFLSRLNSKAKDAKRCLKGRTFATGVTFSMVTDYLAEWFP